MRCPTCRALLEIVRTEGESPYLWCEDCQRAYDTTDDLGTP